jgi:hypothetical protein
LCAPFWQGFANAIFIAESSFICVIKMFDSDHTYGVISGVVVKKALALYRP